MKHLTICLSLGLMLLSGCVSRKEYRKDIKDLKNQLEEINSKDFNLDSGVIFTRDLTEESDGKCEKMVEELEKTQDLLKKLGLEGK